jgi:ABC-type multidrug transport system ATPase subunit
MDGDDNDGVALDKNVVLKWSSLCKFVPTRPLGACILPAPTVHKQLLFDCSGELKSGTITGLMGLSGGFILFL